MAWTREVDNGIGQQRWKWQIKRHSVVNWDDNLEDEQENMVWNWWFLEPQMEKKWKGKGAKLRPTNQTMKKKRTSYLKQT